MTNESWSGSSDAQRYGSRLLTGENVALRGLHESDLSLLTNWWSSPEWSALQRGGICPQPDLSVEAMFRSWSENKANSGDVGFSIVLRDTNALIGHCTLFGATPRIRSAEFAVMIGPEFVGKSLGVETARLMINYGFAELGLNSIRLSVWSYNDRAQRAYAKAGFREDGRRRAATFHDGAFHDEILMSVLASDLV